jgi:hypothetical protein
VIRRSKNILTAHRPLSQCTDTAASLVPNLRQSPSNENPYSSSMGVSSKLVTRQYPLFLDIHKNADTLHFHGQRDRHDIILTRVFHRPRPRCLDDKVVASVTVASLSEVIKVEHN